MGFRGYVAKRIIYSFILIFFVLTLNFAIFTLMPGDPLAAYVNRISNTSEEMAAEIRTAFGLDRPMYERYFIYLQKMFTFNFGKSLLVQSPIAEEIGRRLTNTLLLMGSSAILSIVIGIVLGALAARKRGGILDNTVVISSLTTFSLPVFWIGMVFLTIFCFMLHWFPLRGAYPTPPPTDPLQYVLARLYYLVLPSLTLFLFQYGNYVLLTRACVLETITEDYVLTAKAKGLKERTILFKHVLKNASLPLITNVALTFGFLISGAMITETVFNYPGMGMYILEAINTLDTLTLGAVFYVIGLCVIIANFAADILYGVIDPRVKYG